MMSLQQVIQHGKAFTKITTYRVWSQEESGIPLHVWLTMWGGNQYKKTILESIEKYDKYLKIYNEGHL